MDKACESHHAEDIRLLLSKISSCITDIGGQLELLDELREEIGSEFDEYTDETEELESAYAYLADELHDARAALPISDKKEILQKLFMFDAVTPMTQPERIAVFSFVLSSQVNTADVCWNAGHYLTEYRKDARQNEDGELPFDTNIEETVANLL
jgi:hypothetical protein